MTSRQHTSRMILPIIAGKRALIERHMAKAIPRDNGCVDWAGTTRTSTTKPGSPTYGYLSVKWRGDVVKLSAHRLAYAFHNDQEPGQLMVLHSCDNGLCTAKEHLSLGTHDQNMIEMVDRGRSASRPSITPEQAVAIYQAPRSISARLLAEQMGPPVTSAIVTLIRSGTTWWSVTGAECNRRKKAA